MENPTADLLPDIHPAESADKPVGEPLLVAASWEGYSPDVLSHFDD
jgi:hypothetical protein